VQVAVVFMEMRGVRMAVDAAIGMSVLMRVGVSVIMRMFMIMGVVVGVIVRVFMPFDTGFALAATANGTHLQTPAKIPK